MNGLNGGNVSAMVAGYPTPAGYQAELAYIYSMVDVLSQQLAENKRALEDVVSSVGRVRSRARAQSLGNEDLISSAVDELESQQANIDTTISLLTELFERAKCSRDEYRQLSQQYASVIAAMLKQFHEYKQKHVADVAAWHRSYRAQLAEERAENMRLRDQIWEMQAHAGKANENLRHFRKKYDEDETRWERRVDMKSVRQELRFWKRMAMPELPDDDPYWSDDDDLVDSVEKLRLQEIERRVADEALAGMGNMEQGLAGQDLDLPQGLQSPAMMGGVPMQRDDSGAIPVLPPRPSSAASTGSSGQPS
ncbi:hypothetical protein M406DRAFT_282733 [Cryphonectria parasitica EP155]|uniref:Uncharacterized protein n=1 Tax=Cryphonectria parasitica (strain ATCC 38755 / EP155) TaxID=660469 RepID=A0A9P5CK73_CRYP1|nr:uncharacterized protein M406DRAFT_282733 [Cryphonectria parasitica EP155]KAF3760877.1 hypothetical protein M406DRAFT_282733 [Cryphonectria parasitica EP155]